MEQEESLKTVVDIPEGCIIDSIDSTSNYRQVIIKFAKKKPEAYVKGMKRHDLVRMTQTGRTNSDETAPYSGTPNFPFRPMEFVDAVLASGDEWGTVKLHHEEEECDLVEYKHDTITKIFLIPSEWYGKTVTKVTGVGGWSMMNYVLYIE